MRQPTFVTLLSTLALCLAPAAFATVNHGSFSGTGVDFVDVSETTLTAGDPEPIWGAPSLGVNGDQLLFFPSSFLSSCTGATVSDTTASTLTTTVVAQSGQHIETIRLQEAGDNSLVAFPPFGTPATNVSASLTGTVTITETTGGPIAPVAIPFVGSFTPTANFALPTHFGQTTWTGDIDVDVLSVVPLATRAEVSITNSLASNCAAGNSSALIQKKSVSGPVVALLVNPLECDVEIDKTCCVTQPVLPDLGQCEGDMVSMTLEFTGDECSKSNNDQGRSFKCWGRREIGEPADITALDWQGNLQITPDTDVDHGELVTFTSSTGTLGWKTKFKVQDDWWRKQYLKIGTSCERAFQCGDQFGAFKVVGFESTLGGVVNCNVEPGPAVCAVSGDPVGTPCDAKIVDMVLEYVGQPCQDPLGNPQSGEAVCSGDATGATNVGIQYVGQHPFRQQISPSSMINDGDRIRVTSTWKSGLFPNQKYLITDGSGVRQSVEFHVSCSQPFALGDEFGSFKVVEFTTKAGTRVALGSGNDGPQDACEVPLAPPGPHCTGDLSELTLVYIGDFLGEGCTVSNPQGGYGSCTGDADPGDPVAVVPIHPTVVADPVDQIEFGDLVTLSHGEDGDLPLTTSFDVTGAGGTQTIAIKTSCSKPLSLGDRFGSFVVFGMDRESDGPISLGGNVQYQYAVTNPNDDPLENVAVEDDQLGTIVSGVTLQPFETQTFVQNATLFGTTTNVATATGDIGGDVCDPGVDQLTINVTAPPPGAFSCSEPINGLTMTWNGSQTVLVKAWSGVPLFSPQVGTYEDVAPGDTIEAMDLGAGGMHSVWEIFTANGVTKLGESHFDLWCNDKDMNGIEDCGKAAGNRKWDDPLLINDWLVEGMTDSDESLSCTPGVLGAPPDCGFGPELLVVLPGLMWLHRRRMRKD